MREFWRRWGPLLKGVAFVAVLAGVAWWFTSVLHDEGLRQADHTRSPGEVLWDEARSARPAGLAVGAVLYLLGIGLSALFWLWLLRGAGAPVPAFAAARAYYLSHLGKYVPGKAMSLAMRTAMAAEAGANPGVAVITSVYEILTTMAAGALLAAGLIVWLMRDEPRLVWGVLLLVLVAGVPIVPALFNRVVRRLSARFLKGRPALMPDLGNRTLLAGLAVTGCGWLLLGLSLEAVLWALDPTEPWTLHGWLRSTACVAASNVAGFLTFFPGGLGVREVALVELLGPRFGARAVVVALLLRVLWTAAEFALGAVLWCLPSRAGSEGGVSR
jgi:uncharacterized membrane protein YbhN (UPF0104 family)